MLKPVVCAALQEMVRAGQLSTEQARRILRSIFSIDCRPGNKYDANAFEGIAARAGAVTDVLPDVPGITSEIYAEVI